MEYLSAVYFLHVLHTNDTIFNITFSFAFSILVFLLLNESIQDFIIEWFPGGCVIIGSLGEDMVMVVLLGGGGAGSG